MSDDTTTLVRAIPKNSLEDIHVGLTEFKGNEYVDLRVFASYQERGERKPTRKGVTINPALLPEVIAALQEAEAECIRRGLLPADDRATDRATRYAAGMTS